MSIQLCNQLTAADERMVREATEGFVPDEVFDIHAHLFHSGISRRETAPLSLSRTRAMASRNTATALGHAGFPGRKVNGLFFGYPSAGNNRVGENEWVASQLAAHPEMSAEPEDRPRLSRRMAKKRRAAS